MWIKWMVVAMMVTFVAMGCVTADKKKDERCISGAPKLKLIDSE